jgi:hypothetical protein
VFDRRLVDPFRPGHLLITTDRPGLGGTGLHKQGSHGEHSHENELWCLSHTALLLQLKSTHLISKESAIELLTIP